MKGKDLTVKLLDTLVEMADYCKDMDKIKHEGKIKCSNCELNWRFGLGNHGCFLVETIYNNDKFLYNLIDLCKYQNIEYEDKINKISNMNEI